MCLKESREKNPENSLMVQWLRLCAFTTMAWVQSLVRELRFHMVQPKKKKKKSYREIELYKIMLLDHWKVLRIKFKADDYEICGTQIYLTKKYFSIMT